MSTATIARVRSLTAASTALGSMFKVAGSTSAKTGVAPSRMKQFADATNESGDVITSSPGPTPAMWQSMCRPAVPLETATAYGAPTRSASASSKRWIHGPSDRRPDRRTSRTSSSSRSSIHGRESGISVPENADAFSGVEVCLIASLARLGARLRRASSFGGRGRHRGVLEPVRPALAAAADGVEVRLLDLERDRSRRADDVIVDLADRRHLCGGPAHEDLVR